MNEALSTLMHALMQHIPTGAAWIPLAGALLATAAGIVLISKGAKLAPYMVAIVFLLAGGVGGSFIANLFSLAAWPTIITAGIVGLIAGLAMFRIWLSGILGACFISAALLFYGVKVLSPHLEKYAAEGSQPFDGIIKLHPADALSSSEPRTPSQELSHLWNYLSVQVPNFQSSFYAIVASSGLAGILLGLLASRTARAVCAATAGVALLAGGVSGLLHMLFPVALAWLDSVSPWSWAGVAAIWLSSLIHNIRDCKPAKNPLAGAATAPA